MRVSRTALGVLMVGWTAVVCAGFGLLLRYKAAPAEAHRPPQQWPRASRLQRATGDRATLVLFAHPECPCTQASVSELARLVTEAEKPPSVQIVVVRPAGVTEQWDDTELQRRAATIPGALVVRDEAGVEARRFRATASGFTALYDGSGRLRFAGGLTSSRGHEGDSFGQRRVLAVLKGETPDRDDAPVFGCTLGVEPGGTN